MKNLFKRIIEYIRYGEKRGGLIDEVDERNFGSDSVVKISQKDLVNETFIVFQPTPLDQYNSDHCVGFSAAYGAEATEGIVCSGAFVFAQCKRLSGSIKGFGTSILKMCKVRVKYGIPKKEDWDLKRGRRDYFSNWKKIPTTVYSDAKQHRSHSYFQVITPRSNPGFSWSRFDAIRAYLWKMKDKKILIHTGNNAHAITVIGYDVERDSLICIDSYGERTYNKGIRYIGRREGNALFTPYFLLDIEKSLAELLQKYNNKAVKTEDSIECYKVVNGKKHHIKNEACAWANNVLMNPENYVTIISKGELNTIPTGDPLTFEEGENAEIVKIMLKKFNKLDLINNE